MLLVVRRDQGSGSQAKMNDEDLIQGIIATMAKQIARWWLPNAVIFVKSLPRTATGKLSKISLREEYRDFTFPPESPS